MPEGPGRGTLPGTSVRRTPVSAASLKEAESRRGGCGILGMCAFSRAPDWEQNLMRKDSENNEGLDEGRLLGQTGQGREEQGPRGAGGSDETTDQTGSCLLSPVPRGARHK